MDNFVTPSSLVQERDEKSVDSYTRSFSNLALRTGIVLAVYDIEDEQNVSKLGPEYDVMAIEQDASFGLNTTIYKNCIMSDGAGGVADFFQMKLRAVKDPKKTKAKGSFKNETGSLVKILCIDGFSEKAMIVGMVQNPSKKVLTKEKGVHLEGEYNGVNYQVNKDGELTVTFRSATNDDGTVKNKDASGSFFKFDKDGSFEINDKNTESFRIDKKLKTIAMKAAKDISNTTDANFNVTTKESINLKATKDLIATIDGKVTIDAKQPSVFKCAGALTIEAPTVNIQGTDMIMAQASQIQLLGNQVIVGNGAVPAIVPTTQFVGIGNAGAPVISTAIGPFSSTVMIGV